MISKCRKETKSLEGQVQAKRASVALSGCMAVLLPLAVPLWLGACSSVPNAINPVEWWRGLQGGKIAEQRPAPPGTNDPAPNLGSIPERPTPTDPKFREQLANALIADRANAQHMAGSAPLPDPSNPAAAPARFGRGALPPPGPAPAEASARASAPGKTDAPTASGTGSSATPPLVDRAAAMEAAEPTALPALPGNPPPSANLPGAPSSAPVRSAPTGDVAAVVTAPTPSTAASPVTPVADAAVAPRVAPVQIAFGPGSATLPRNATASLRQLAAKRGAASIAVTGYGDATSGQPAAQSAALSLGLARAQAIANALTASGVPTDVLRVDAEAAGRGGAARLVE